ncbi:MAG: acetylornithine transaminase [Alphaproteobacteria bacterium HGW-Alphaproteobacteria-18]|nr:MAG: acetylornithine transaminase [Alphaproteobacteria bacterium HGW-Alphaproteobacteria-18]
MSRDSLFPTYSPPNIRFAAGEGSWLTDIQGRRYLDFIAGISVNTLGHAHPALVAALHDQAQKLWHLSNMFDVPGQSKLAQRYCDLTFADRVFFTNSGAESIECALKSARRYHAANGDPDRVNVIGFEGAFHGRTYATINAAGNPKYLEGFGPPLPGYVQAPFGDIEALKALVGPDTAAILIEPVQGEGGLRAAPVDYLEGLRKLCNEHGVLLIYDEVQCGAGRTGQLFAHQWSDKAAPDIMAVAKGVGGGFPLGMCLATEAVARHMTPGTHGTTYGGNALAVAVGAAILDHITEKGFLDNVSVRSAQLRGGLESLRSQYPDLIVEIRGKGLLTGFKVSGIANTDFRDALRESGLLVGIAGDNVIRLAPPLNVKPEEIDEALAKLASSLAGFTSKTGRLASASS